MWKYNKRKDKRKFEAIKDHNGDNILDTNWQTIEIYTIWDFVGKKWKIKK